MSNNKLFKAYLNERQALMRRSDPNFRLNGNLEFITKCRNDWKVIQNYFYISFI